MLCTQSVKQKENKDSVRGTNNEGPTSVSGLGPSFHRKATNFRHVVIATRAKQCCTSDVAYTKSPKTTTTTTRSLSQQICVRITSRKFEITLPQYIRELLASFVISGPMCAA